MTPPAAAEARGYHGGDRRSAAAAATPARRAEVLGPVFLLFALAGALGAVWSGQGVSPATSDLVVASVSAATTGLAAVAGSLLVLRGRLAGSIRGAAVGVAVLVLMAAHPALQAIGLILGQPRAGLPQADIALLVAGAVLLLGELPRPAVDTRRRLWAVVAVAAGVGLFAAVMTLSERHAQVTAGPPWLGVTGVGLWPRVTVAAILGGLAVMMGSHAMRRRLQLDYWVAMALAAWSSGIALAAAEPGKSLAPIAVAGLRGAGVAVLGGALLMQLSRDYVAQRSQLYRSQVSEMATVAEQRAVRAKQRRRAHDARSVVLAVQAAGAALHQDLSGLSEDDKATLASILQSGMAKLDRYVTGGPDATFVVSSLGDTAREEGRRIGVPVKVDLLPELTVRGDGAGAEEAMRLVVGFAAEGAWVSALQVRSETHDSEARVCVEAAGGPTGGRGGADQAPALAVVAAAELVRRSGGGLEPYRTGTGGRGYAMIWPLNEDSADEQRFDAG